MKKIFLLSFLFLFLSLSQVQAAGLVPCGGEGEPSCQICHLFELLDRIMDRILFNFVPIIATVMLIVGGIMFFFAGGNPNALQTAKGIIKSVVIGLIIIFAAFLIVGSMLQAIGLADWTEEFYKNWWSEGAFQIECQ